MSKRKTKSLAERIARHLFTPGGLRVRADRIDLTKDGRYLGGWAYRPAIIAIQKVIDADAKTPVERPTFDEGQQ